MLFLVESDPGRQQASVRSPCRPALAPRAARSVFLRSSSASCPDHRLIGEPVVWCLQYVLCGFIDQLVDCIGYFVGREGRAVWARAPPQWPTWGTISYFSVS